MVEEGVEAWWKEFRVWKRRLGVGEGFEGSEKTLRGWGRR